MNDFKKRLAQQRWKPQHYAEQKEAVERLRNDPDLAEKVREADYRLRQSIGGLVG